MFKVKQYLIPLAAAAAICGPAGDATATELKIDGEAQLEQAGQVRYTVAAVDVNSRFDATLEWQTIDSGPNAGTATPNVDYVPSTGTVTVHETNPAGTFSVKLIDDNAQEASETIAVHFVRSDSFGVLPPALRVAHTAYVLNDDNDRVPPPPAPGPGPPPAAVTELSIDSVDIAPKSVPVELTCEAQQPCKGKLGLKVRKKGKVLTLGSSKYSVAPGATTVVRVPVKAKNVKLINALGELTVEATSKAGKKTTEEFAV